MTHVDYLGRRISVGDVICLLNPMRMRVVETLLPTGAIVATTPDGTRVLLPRPGACIVRRTAVAASEPV